MVTLFLDLPPYHCDLNSIEMIWSSMKRHVAEHNIGKSDAEMPRLVADAFNKISTAVAKTLCPCKEYWKGVLKKDAYLDEPFIITLDSESESSDSDDDITEFDNSTIIYYSSSCHVIQALPECQHRCSVMFFSYTVTTYTEIESQLARHIKLHI